MQIRLWCWRAVIQRAVWPERVVFQSPFFNQHLCFFQYIEDLSVGYIPGLRGAHSQGETLDELNHNLKEVVELLLEDGEPELETEFVGTQSVVVA